MANEHILVLQKTAPVPFTVSNTVAIPKGSLLKYATPRTASSANGTNDLIAGVAVSEKIASDGRTTLGVIAGPGDEFVAYLSGTGTVGDCVSSIATYTNYIASTGAASALSGIKRLGFLLESGTNGQQVRYRMDTGVAK